MAVYFFPKSRLISKAANFKPIPNKWSTKWTIVRRSVTTKQTPVTSNTNAGSGSHQSGSSDGSGSGGSNQKVLDWWLLAAGGWLSWRGVFMRWTPLGLCMIAAAQWHLHNRELDLKGLPRTAAPWQMNVYCSLPLRLMSRCWGWLADCRLPIPARPVVYGIYSSAFGVNLDEAASPDFKNYRSLAEFFARRLREDARYIDPNSCIVSPCDGRVLHFGSATDSQIEQVKGVSYSLEAFLGPPTWCDSKNNNNSDNLNNSHSYLDKVKNNLKGDSALYQCIIYLAPGDYHRFHSPTSWNPEIRRHFCGELLSVSPKIAKWMPGLFCLNERALYIGKWMHGFFSFTAVGATNVGSVQIYMDEKLKTNQWTGIKIGSHRCKDFEEFQLPEGTALGKGELLGQFNFGSTIVLIFEAPKDFKFNIQPGQIVRMGQRLGCLNNEKIDNDENLEKKSI